MMKNCILASLVASSAAFAPATQSSTRSSSLSAAIDDMPGAINWARKPMKFDPLKLSETYEPLVPWFREAELKHGRTAMLATVGFFVQDFVRLPGDAYSFETVPKTIDAHDTLLAMGAQSPMGQLVLWIGLWDLLVTGPAAVAAHNGERTPGDYGMEAYLERKPMPEEKVSYMVDSELLNGRLAMIAVGGIATQSITTGHGFPWV